jgi:hypothetical protein
MFSSTEGSWSEVVSADLWLFSYLSYLLFFNLLLSSFLFFDISEVYFIAFHCSTDEEGPVQAGICSLSGQLG